MDELSEPTTGLEFIGPLEIHAVVLNGRRVPYLSAMPLPGGRIYLTLDDRFATELSVREAESFVPFVAHCIAVGMGYAAFPDSADEDPRPRPAMPRMRNLDSVLP